MNFNNFIDTANKNPEYIEAALKVPINSPFGHCSDCSAAYEALYVREDYDPEEGDALDMAQYSCIKCGELIREIRYFLQSYCLSELHTVSLTPGLSKSSPTISTFNQTGLEHSIITLKP